MKKPGLAFEPREETTFVEMSGIVLQTRPDILEFFDYIDAWWRKTCNGMRVYYVVDYTGFTLNLRENDCFAERMKQTVDLSAITVIRYGGDDLQRSAARLRGLKVHTASNLYQTREEAIGVLQSLRAGAISLKTV
jgi:hypothetical protein